MWWDYFSSKKISIKSAKEKASVSKKDADVKLANWCLFETSDADIGSGVFFSSLSPGIRDCRNGILYVVPGEYMDSKSHMSLGVAHNARMAILEFYGIDTKPHRESQEDLFLRDFTP